MIALASDYMMFKLANGDTVPFSPMNISIEVDAATASPFDTEFIHHAANAVFHFFQHELKRETISVAEFAEAMEKVLSGFAPGNAAAPTQKKTPLHVLESDLVRLAQESGRDAELFFFSNLREELRRQLKQAPHVVRFRGLRCCVKHLTGARRWNGRCRQLEEQIVEYLRKCLNAEPSDAERALVVD
jgi:hypothetical protein